MTDATAVLTLPPWLSTSGRLPLPVLLAVTLALVAGARFEQTRPVEAVAVAAGLPVVAAVAGAFSLRDGSPGLRGLALGASLLLIGACEVAIVPELWGGAHAPMPLLATLLAGAVVAAAWAEGWGASRGISSRFGAWSGFAAGLALYLPGHVGEKADQLFGAVFGALMVGLFAGGGLGLALGVVARHVAKRSAG